MNTHCKRVASVERRGRPARALFVCVAAAPTLFSARPAEARAWFRGTVHTTVRITGYRDGNDQVYEGVPPEMRCTYQAGPSNAPVIKSGNADGEAHASPNYLTGDDEGQCSIQSGFRGSALASGWAEPDGRVIAWSYARPTLSFENTSASRGYYVELAITGRQSNNAWVDDPHTERATAETGWSLRDTAIADDPLLLLIGNGSCSDPPGEVSSCGGLDTDMTLNLYVGPRGSAQNVRRLSLYNYSGYIAESPEPTTLALLGLGAAFVPRPGRRSRSSAAGWFAAARLQSPP